MKYIKFPPESELWIYRDRTTAMLRRYFRLSVELGRLPSLLGREFFRARVTSYRMHSFEDAVIFVHDVENCLCKLDDLSRQLLGRIVLQEYRQDETARLLHCPRRRVVRKFPQALDALTGIFLARELLQILPCHSENGCQELQFKKLAASSSEDGK